MIPATIIARFGAMNLMPFLYAGLAAACLGVVVFLVDAIGDRREAVVYARINRAIEKTNADVKRFSNWDDQIAAIAYDARVKALADARKITADSCVLSPEQVQALNRIR